MIIQRIAFLDQICKKEIFEILSINDKEDELSMTNNMRQINEQEYKK